MGALIMTLRRSRRNEAVRDLGQRTRSSKTKVYSVYIGVYHEHEQCVCTLKSAVSDSQLSRVSSPVSMSEMIAGVKSIL